MLFPDIGYEFPVWPKMFPWNRELANGDGFALDCPHRQFFSCPLSKGSLRPAVAAVPQCEDLHIVRIHSGAFSQPSLMNEWRRS
jgi:hypothetical protein